MSEAQRCAALALFVLAASPAARADNAPGAPSAGPAASSEFRPPLVETPEQRRNAWHAAAGHLRLHVQPSDPRAELRQVWSKERHFDFWSFRVQTELKTHTFCTGACGIWLDAEDRQREYFISGTGVTDSRMFKLESGAPALTLKVRAGNHNHRIGGWFLLGLGGAVALGGLDLCLLLTDRGLGCGLGVPMVALGLAAVGGSIAVLLRSRTLVEMIPEPAAPIP